MNPMKMVKQLQQLQEKQERLQRELEQSRITAAAGGEMVTVTMNGKREVVAVKIDRQVVNPEDVEMLEDLLLAALAECGRKVDAEVQSRMSEMTAGMNLPGF